MNLHGRELGFGKSGDDVRTLHDDLARIGVKVPEGEKKRAYFGKSTEKRIAALQKAHGLEPTGICDEQLSRIIAERAATESITVTGAVASKTRFALDGLRVEILDRNVGRDDTVGEAVTDRVGEYAATIRRGERGNETLDIFVRVYEGDALVGTSDVRYDVDGDVAIDVALREDATGVVSEFGALSRAIAPIYDGRLADLKEDDDHADVSYLANKTGWDARAVAIAALADQFTTYRSNGQSSAIAPEFYYALFRAGLPANPDTLFLAPPELVRGVWKNAVAAGVISADLEEKIDRSVEAFHSLSALRILERRPVAGMSAVGELLTHALGEDPKQHRQFSELFARYRTEPEKMWSAVAESFGQETVTRLQLDGRLAYLTLNNAPLIGRMHDVADLREARDLARAGFFRPEQWLEIIDEQIPEVIPGESLDVRRERYAEMLAAQVRISFPTGVLAAQVRSGEVPIMGGDDLRVGVHSFLSEHEGEFEIGMHPVEQFIVSNQLDVAEEIRGELKTLQRVYQITPSDQAMTTMITHGLNAAYHVAAMSQPAFIEKYADALGGVEQAELVHAKSLQVHNATLNIAASYLNAYTSPALGGDPQALIVDPVAGKIAGNASAAPALEKLFGAMDYCACDHCRSVLSPAAYLVDLLMFTDTPANGSKSPLQVLLDRRPDLQHLPLTCENTNTALPYIDIVNEVLEYFVTQNGSIVGFTGHDTGDRVTSAELMASPQYVQDAAYTTLDGSFFPPPLPYDNALETLRRHFDAFEIPLHEAMAALRTGESLESSPAAYGWRDILAEVLKLSRGEYRLLTDRTIALWQIYGFATSTSDSAVRDSLVNVKALTRRCGVTYEELSDILRTRFMNPAAGLVPKLERLGVTFADIRDLKEGTITDAQFVALLAPGLDIAEYDGDVAAWVKDDRNYPKIMSLVTLVDESGAPQTASSFQHRRLRYSHPDPAQSTVKPFELLKLARFIRLWRKLGWTIEQTDDAIAALYPPSFLPTGAGDAADVERLDKGFLAMLPRLGVAVQTMTSLNLKPRHHLQRLLSLWSPIDATGESSLYRQMFATRSILDQDPAFAVSPYGEVLENAAEMLLNHEETLRAAFALTDAELRLIVAALGFDSSTRLTLDAISAVHRRAWLARTLKVSVSELLTLIRVSGIDPFAMPEPPAPGILRFVDLLDALRLVSLKPVQALSLIWNESTKAPSKPEVDPVPPFVRTLRAALAAVDSQFAAIDDPKGDLTRARMALVYGSEATDTFFGLLFNTLAVEVDYTHTEPELDEAILVAGDRRLAYDDLRRKLISSGVFTSAHRDAVKAVPGTGSALKAAADALHVENESLVNDFFERFPELQAVYASFDSSAAELEVKLEALRTSLLTALRSRKKRQQALAEVASAATTDAAFAQRLLEDAEVLQSASAADPAVSDLVALEAGGLAASLFWSASVGTTPDEEQTASGTIDHSVHNKVPGKPPGLPSFSGVWTGFVEAPETGTLSVGIVADPGAMVSVTLDGKAVALLENAGTWRNAAALTVTAGTLYPITIKVENTTERLALRWATPGRGWEAIPAKALYSATLVAALRQTFVRFLKTASLAAAVHMTPEEIAHFARLPIAGRAWPNALVVTGPTPASTATALRDVLLAVLTFARLKTVYSPDDERLLQVVREPAATVTDSDGTTRTVLSTITGWEPASVDTLLSHFGKTSADLSSMESLGRVDAAFAIVNEAGVSAAALLAATTNTPGPAVVRDFQSALRARYDEAKWLEAVRPINDDLRARRRDALVAWVLQKLSEKPETSGIDTADRLFEHFLMDVQMEPCMQTSRIRHALSSVQLFIERSLMNLEPDVAVSAMDAGEWAWMKRYRVWEANRKVFLWPENWLEPEFRDNQSPFFEETVSELLQSDITEDSAEVAVLNYLAKLEQVAKLRPCGIAFEDEKDGVTDDVAHVVAATEGANRKYFYRRREGVVWTPWEPIKLDIEDNPVIPVVWEGRLLLFWLRVIQQTPIDPRTQKKGKGGPSRLAEASMMDVRNAATRDAKARGEVTYYAVLCFSELYNGKWQEPKTSSVADPVRLRTAYPAGSGAFNRQDLVLEPTPHEDRLWITISGDGVDSASFVLYNTHGAPLRASDENQQPKPMPWTTRSLTFARPSMKLEARYGKGGSIYEHAILESYLRLGIVEARHPMRDPWAAPFFVTDRRHSFYVTSERKWVKVGKFGGIGVLDLPPVATEIPKLVNDSIFEGIPDIWGPIIKGPGYGVVDPSPIEDLLSEDAFIRNAVTSTAPVTYGKKTIGPAGAIGNGPSHA